MSESRVDRVQGIFTEALQRPADERAAYVQKQTGSDVELRTQILDLLSALGDAGSFMANPTDERVVESLAGAATVVSTPSEKQGEQIGRYKLLQQIGEGGFGTVWMAEQKEPVRRRVALKIIKLGMDTKQVIARFEAERQALAMMDHPHISTVFDAGATDTGRPYFVMELVKGVPITEYCDQNNLTVHERLDLFRLVCAAVQHAHQKGIIHRDLKPSNVLVTLHDGQPVPKVIDFGIAKATNAEVTEKTLFTEHRQMVGTPEYMSPEQAEMTGLDIDTRSDIYGLGVLLYELLTGTTPFDGKRLRSAGLNEIQRIIREEDPHKPSTRVSALDTLPSIAAQRKVNPAKLGLMFRGDLDWIIMKALEKDRTRRYETAIAFAEDIDRHLGNEPVHASPPSSLYRLRKFVRRNRSSVVVTATFAVVLVAATAVSIGFGFSEGLQREIAESARTDAQKSLVVAREQEQLAIASRNEAEKQEQRADLAREHAEAAQKAENKQWKRAEQRADELETVTKFQASMLGEIDAEKMGRSIILDQRSRIRERLTKDGTSIEAVEIALASFDRLVAMINATDLALKLVDEQVLRRAVNAIEWDFADQPLVRAALQQTVASTYVEIGRYAPALPLQAAALKTRRAQLGDDDPLTRISINSMGHLLHVMNRYEEAEPYYREALESRRRTLGDDHQNTLTSIGNMGALLDSMGKPGEALPYFREALEGKRVVLGNDHPNTLASIHNMGYLLSAMGEPEEALPFYREALDRKRHVLGDDHPDTLVSIGSMGSLLASMGQLEEAEPYHRTAMEGNRRVLGDDHPRTLRSIVSMGGLLNLSGQPEEAEPYYREALDGRRRVLGDDHADTLDLIRRMGLLLKAMGRSEEALPYYHEVMEGRRRVLGGDHPQTLISIDNVGALLYSMDRPDEALPYFREALAGFRRVLGNDHPDTLISIKNMGVLLNSRDRHEEAEPLFRELLEMRRRTHPEGDARIALDLVWLGMNLMKQEKYAQAEPLLRECLEIRKETMPAGHWLIFNTRSVLGGSLARQGTDPLLALGSRIEKLREAEPLLLESYAKLNEAAQAIPPAERAKRLRQAVQRIIELYNAWHEAEPNAGHAAEADKWRTKLSDSDRR